MFNRKLHIHRCFTIASALIATIAVGLVFSGACGELPVADTPTPVPPDSQPSPGNDGSVPNNGGPPPTGGGSLPPAPLLPSNGLPEQCEACHPAPPFAVHRVPGNWQLECTSCHEPNHSGPNLSHIKAMVRNETLGREFPVEFRARTGPGSFSDGVGANDGICQVCHTSTSHHRHDGGGTLHNEGADCVSCHTHQNGFLPRSCIGCHSSSQGSRPKIVNADGSGGHHLAGLNLTDADCSTCHDMSRHQQGAVRLWSDPTASSQSFAVSGEASQLTSFCTACHNGVTHPAVHAPAGPWQPACTECHEPHDPTNRNLRLVRNAVFNRTLGIDLPVAFTARTGPGSFSDGVGANDGICQVCHTSTSHHRYDGGGTPHNEGVACVACHTHQNGFLPTSCMGCHASAQGPRRAIVGEFGLVSHHVRGTALSDADCQVCHDMSAHQGGHVRLRNVDEPTNPAQVVTLFGDPLTNAAEARRCEPFCLACHDADAAGGQAPFASGSMPPPIDAGLWAAGSHAIARMTCLGDGETFGCHGTGHGSIKIKLQGPWNARQPGVPGDPLRQEEGMCYSCHDADGPASTNVQAQFSLATHHNVSALEQTDGSKIECRHCHDPHTTRATALLVDPDAGGVWAGTGEAFCLTCHDGAAPVGVAFPPVSHGTGFNKASFMGTTHDTTTGTDSCRHCHLPHGSAETALLRRKYVVTDYNSYSPGDGDYSACWLCHDENAVVQLDNAFANRHKKHVKDERAPCVICHDAHRGFDAGERGLIDLESPLRRGGYDLQFIGGRNGSTSFWLNAAQTQGSCYIRCHGESHTPENYPRAPAPTTNCRACH